MMTKKGFTLVELLAVIAILAILILIALPNVMSLFTEAKANSFTTELKNIYKSAQQQWMRDSMFDTNERVYARYNNGNCANELKLSGRNNIEYYIKINKGGKVIEYYATDGTYQYSYKGNDLEVENIKDVKEISKITNGRLVSISCTGGRVASPEPASPNDYLMDGTSGGATSNYLRTTIKKENIEKITFTDSIEGRSVNGTDTWDVSKGSTSAVLAWATDTDNNGLYELTIGANGEVYATNGNYLFYNLINLESINGMVNFNTSKTTSMASMFSGCGKLKSLDLSNFDTSNVTDMSYMFEARFELYDTAAGGYVEYYDIFGSLKNLNLSNFDVSNVTNMSSMFRGQHNLINIFFGNWNTSKVTSLASMFEGCLNLETIDLSSFDTSNVTRMDNMFSIPVQYPHNDDVYFRFNGENLYVSHYVGISNGYLIYAASSGHPDMKIKTIYASDMFNTNNLILNSYTNNNTIFNYTPNLIGGSGTTFDSNHTDKEYAHIDGGPSNPGYFTRK